MERSSKAQRGRQVGARTWRKHTSIIHARACPTLIIPSTRLKSCPVPKLGLLRAKPPHVSVAQVRKPYRPVRDPDRIASRTEPLLHNGIRSRIDFTYGNLEHRRPNMSFPECDLSTRSRDANLYIRDQLAGFRVHSR